MHGKFLFTVILSVTMASFFIPGIAHDNFASSQPQAITNSAGKPASSEPKTSFQVYIPLLSQQPVTEVAVDQPVEITPTPEPTAESEKQPIKLDMDMNFHSQRWETSVKNACGPTSLLMVLDYFGEGKPLPTIIKSFKVAPDKGGFDPSCKQNPVCLSAAVLEEMARGTFKLAVEAHE